MEIIRKIVYLRKNLRLCPIFGSNYYIEEQSIK